MRQAAAKFVEGEAALARLEGREKALGQAEIADRSRLGDLEADPFQNDRTGLYLLLNEHPGTAGRSGTGQKG